MKSVDITEKMVLGTVQFGMDYGIANVSGKPTNKEVFSILTLAWEKGICRLDTAPGYGSEKILGEFIKSNGLQNEAKVLTKIPSLEGYSNYQKFIRTSIETSLNNIKCPIDVLFFHRPKDSLLLRKDPDFFKELLSEYPVSILGVSVYERQEVEKLSDSQFELAFQVPYNVLDRRFENVSIRAGKRYARSIFLQGLLASTSEMRKNSHRELLEMQQKYHAVLNKNHQNPIQFALSFVANARNIDYFLFGVDTVGQLLDILNLNIYDNKQMNIVNKLQLNIDHKWLDPRKWI